MSLLQLACSGGLAAAATVQSALKDRLLSATLCANLSTTSAVLLGGLATGSVLIGRLLQKARAATREKVGAVKRGRFMAVVPEFRGSDSEQNEFVVFLIGSSINSWSALFSSRGRRLLAAMSQMPVMLKELKQSPHLGMMHFESYGILGLLFGQPSVIISYWESKEKLMAFARDSSRTHHPAWLAFNKILREEGEDEGLGIYHETYVVSRDRGYENIYRNMPCQFGLAGAVGASQLQKPSAKKASAARRFGQEDNDMASTAGFEDYSALKQSAEGGA